MLSCFYGLLLIVTGEYNLEFDSGWAQCILPEQYTFFFKTHVKVGFPDVWAITSLGTLFNPSTSCSTRKRIMPQSKLMFSSISLLFFHAEVCTQRWNISLMKSGNCARSEIVMGHHSFGGAEHWEQQRVLKLSEELCASIKEMWDQT